MAGEWAHRRSGRASSGVRGPHARVRPRVLERLRRSYVRKQPSRRGQHGRGRAPQHPPPLRPVQRDVRAVPRRDDDLLVGAVHGDPATRRTGRRAAPQGRPAARRTAGRARSRVLEIGTGWGELAIRAAQRGAPVTTLTISDEQAALAPRRVADAGVSRPGRRAAARLPRVERPLRRHRQRRDDRGGRASSTGRLLRARSTGCARRTDRRCRRSAGRRPHAGDRRDVHLDSEVHLPRRAAALRSGDRGDRAPAHRLRVTTVTRSASTTRETLRLWRERFDAHARPRSPRSASTRRSAACGSSTWPTARRASHRLPRRQPDHHRKTRVGVS